MNQGISPVRTASKDILARAMAQEDISVQHSASAETAYFDTKTRVLCLPIWQDMDHAMYDMLVGHEVSHALHTPADGWQDFVGEGRNAPMRHMYLNVVEDARIERMIKDKFPGLRRDFAKAYKSLEDRNLFDLDGKTITDLPLVDRLNLQFKLGIHCQMDVPFTAEEQQYVTRMAETKTFEEVMTLAQDLFKDQQEKEEQKQQQESADEGEDGQGVGVAAGADTDEDSDPGQGFGQSGDESGQGMEDDTDDGKSADSQDGNSDATGEEEGHDLSYEAYANGGDVIPGETQRAFEGAVSDLRDNNAANRVYVTLPKPNLENIVVGFSEIADLWTSAKKHHAGNAEETTNRNLRLRTYRNSIKGIVAQMVQQFQMKQAADADKKTHTAKTGLLDPVRMIDYRWSEDIFLKNEVHPDGKNHGMIMYLDWSSSMSGILKDTIEQLIVLVEFCRKVNIPYEVYAFSSNEYNPHNGRRSAQEYQDYVDNREKFPQWDMQRDTDASPHTLSLYNFLSSQMNTREYETALANLWTIVDHSGYYYGGDIPTCLHLGCTPLNEAVVCAMSQVPEFQNRNDIQIVNTVFLTDGEGHSMLRGYGHTFVTDSKTKKNYDTRDPNGHYGETMSLLSMLRDRTGTNLVGIRLCDSNSLKNLRYYIARNNNDQQWQQMCQDYKVNNFTTLKSAYDEYFLIKGNLKVETDIMENLEEDASYTRIKNAFIKGGNRKKSSRVIANKMVDIFAA